MRNPRGESDRLMLMIYLCFNRKETTTPVVHNLTHCFLQLIYLSIIEL